MEASNTFGKSHSLIYLYKQELGVTLKLSLPIIIAQIGMIGMGVADTIMIGKFDAIALGASGIANGIFFVVGILGIGILSIVSPLTATAKSQDDKATCAVLLASSIQIALVVGGFLSLVLVGLAYNIHWFRQTQEVALLTQPYLMIIAFSLIPMLVFLGAKNFTDGLSLTIPAMVITFLCLMLNILLNWMLIFGKLGFPVMGLEGAGWATLISRLLMVVGIFWIIFKSQKIRSYLPHFSLLKFNLTYWAKILQLGVPTGMQFIFEIGAFSGSQVLIGWLGTHQLAAHQVGINLAAVTYMSAIGFSVAGSIRVGEAMGQHKPAEVIRRGTSALILVIVFMSVSCLAFILFNDFWVSLYLKPNELLVKYYAIELLVIAGFFQFSDGIQCVGLGILRGVQDVNVPTILTFIAYWLVALPLSYVFAFVFDMGVQGVWYGLLLGLTFSAVTLTIRFYGLMAQNKNF
jgi:multidrug resistance protein, MATE family